MNAMEEQELRSIAREEVTKILKGEFTKKIMREYLFSNDTLEAIWVVFNGKPKA